MRFYRKAEAAAQQILQAFQSGDLPKAIAPVFVNRKDDVPCRSWSWSNQLLAAIAGTSDARGFRQWEKIGRRVTKGAKSFPILVPICRKRTAKGDDGTEEETTYVAGFTSAAVFTLEQTEGAPLPPPDPQVLAWLESLPQSMWRASGACRSMRSTARTPAVWATTNTARPLRWVWQISRRGPTNCVMLPEED